MIALQDAGVELAADPSRVVASLFLPGESTPGAISRSEQVTQRVLTAPRAELEAAAAQVREFTGRHPGFEELLRANAVKILPEAEKLDDALMLVLGATFTAEYATEGAALCNPSAVAAPDQSGVAVGALRVVVSLRSVGEGHVSAISFATATIGPDGSWVFDERALPLTRATVSEAEWEVERLRAALEHDGGVSEVAHAVLQKLPSRARASDIERVLRRLPREFSSHQESRERLEAVRLAARSAYDAVFAADSILSQRVLLPAADGERHGMEDARLVRFVDDDGGVDYRGTYTAYDGQSITSGSITTSDFVSFAVRPLTGPPARTKGMALFPRRVGGRLLSLTRSGGEVISLAESDDGHAWRDVAEVAAPVGLWEVVQTGNCGPPIETDRGWLVLTHGVGPMRRYSLGAVLLDLEDPSRLVARLDGPLLEPEGSRREGYVPNVVYSCGGVLHDGTLWIPYGVGDSRVRVASVPIAALLDAMTPVVG